MLEDKYGLSNVETPSTKIQNVSIDPQFVPEDAIIWFHSIQNQGRSRSFCR
uniref:Uncharacterized protein n=1 Tax=Setaria italica TaxID=4555 RepID=K4AI09_SETIT